MTSRQALIIDFTEKYKKDNKEEYKAICKEVKKRRRKLFDTKSGLVKDKKGRAAASIPQTLFGWLDFALDNPRFIDDSPEGTKELKWFLKKYPEFLIPSEY
jgi:GTPase involved in cell partitioning and DNA repair